jgi:hypothetical protein
MSKFASLRRDECRGNPLSHEGVPERAEHIGSGRSFTAHVPVELTRRRHQHPFH